MNDHNMNKESEMDREYESEIEALLKAEGSTVQRQVRLGGQRPDFSVEEPRMIVECTRAHDQWLSAKNRIVSYRPTPYGTSWVNGLRDTKQWANFKSKVEEKTHKYKKLVEDHDYAFVVAIRDDQVGSGKSTALSLAFGLTTLVVHFDNVRVPESRTTVVQSEDGLFKGRPYLSGILYTETGWEHDTDKEWGPYTEQERGDMLCPSYHILQHLFIPNPDARIPSKAEWPPSVTLLDAATARDY